MLQELIRIPLPKFLQEFFGRPYLSVYGYGLMLVIAFLTSAQLMKYLARRKGLDGEVFVNAALIGLLAGIIGARLSHIIESIASGRTEFAWNGKPAWDNFKAMLNVSSGGLTFYGGFLLATPVLIWYAIRKRIPLLVGMDIVAPCLMLGLALGRVGCFFNGCCYGEESHLGWAVQFPYGSNAYIEQYERGEITPNPKLLERLPDGRTRLLTRDEAKDRGLESVIAGEHARPVHPTELYSTFNSLLVMAVLLAFFTLTPAPGRVFALMLILEGASRFLLEMLRVEPPVAAGMSLSMWIGLGLVIAGAIMWIGCGRLQKDPGGRIAVAPAGG